MKKILLAIAIVFVVGFGAKAQYFGNDNLFNDWNDGSNNRTAGGGASDPGIGAPLTPIGSESNSNAPLGSGLLILTALGAGYAVARKRKEDKM